MDFLLTLNFWLAIGMLFAIGEVFSGSFVLLAFSVTAFLVAGILLLFPDAFENWQSALLSYSLLSFLISIYPLMRLRRQGSAQDDIND